MERPLFVGGLSPSARIPTLRASTSGSVYTPQMVVNGRTEFVGNDSSRAAAAIDEAARRLRDSQTIAVIAAAGNAVDVKIANAGPRPLNVLLAITESDLSTQVGRGENHGRLLRHTAVVRELRKIGQTSSGQFAAHPQLSLDPAWRRDKLRAVIFLQDPSTLEDRPPPPKPPGSERVALSVHGFSSRTRLALRKSLAVRARLQSCRKLCKCPGFSPEPGIRAAKEFFRSLLAITDDRTDNR